MHVDFSQLTFDSFERPEAPVLMLQKPHGEIIGPLGHYTNLKLELKYNDTSTGTFEYPRSTDGSPTPFYDQLVVDKLIRIDPYGVFVVEAPEDAADGVKQSKTITMQSLEYELAGKKAIFAQGTYNLWNPADQENTLLHIALENARNWSVGYVSASLIGRYRTFDDTDSDVLSFLRGGVQESYGCVFVFDTYNRKVHAYDASEEAALLPIYFSYNNLLKEGNLKEAGENLITKLYVQGSDGIDIRNVNPTGDNYLYNLDWYIQNEDLGGELSAKWTAWRNDIFARQAYYIELVALRSSATGRLSTESAKLTDLQNELSTLENIRAAWLQQQSSAEHYDPEGQGGQEWEATIEYATQRLEETAQQYEDLREKITEQQRLIDSIQDEIDSHSQNISAVNQELKITSYFTSDELDVLDHYFKEDTLQDETFAVYDVSVGGTGSFANFDAMTLCLSGVRWTPVDCQNGHHLAAIAGGSASIDGEGVALTATIIRGTIDYSDTQVVCSLYLGEGTLDGNVFPSGNLTLVGAATYSADVLSGMTEHEDTQYSQDESVSHTTIYYTGGANIAATDASLYFTRNTTEYQRYSVEQDLYDHAEKRMLECAFPTYEFEVSSGNILYSQQFVAFRNELQLGSRCYLQIDERRLLTPVLIELHLDFEKQDGFNLVFANKFRRPDNVNNLKDALAESSSATRTLNLKKLAYGENNNTTTWVKSLLDEGFNAAMAQINSGESAVTIDKAGVKIESADGQETIFLGNGMIALRDQLNGTTKLKMAMGHFKDPSGADYVGVLADVIAGTLVAGQSLVIECPSSEPGGVMQFKVDASGVVINNGCFYMRENGRAVCIDPSNGFMLGKTDMIEWKDDGTVGITWGEGKTIGVDDFDSQNLASLWLSPEGNAYFKGNVYAVDGRFNGVVQARQFLDSKGNDVFDRETKSEFDYLDLGGIVLDGTNGKITLTGSIAFEGDGEITWGNKSPIKSQFAPTKTASEPEEGAEPTVSQWSYTMRSTDKYRRDWNYVNNLWGAPYQFVGADGKNGSNGSDADVTWANIRSALQNPPEQSFITATTAGAPVIHGGEIYGAVFYGNEFNVYPESTNSGATLSLYGYGGTSSSIFNLFSVEGYYSAGVPYVNITSQAQQVRWHDKHDFSDADVTGLYFRFA